MPSDNKTIEVRIQFWTDGLGANGDVRPQHAWAYGTVYVSANRRHGIRAAESIPFNTMAELPSAIEKVLVESGVRLHVGPDAAKLYEPWEPR